MKQKIEGQVSLNTLYRTQCLLDKTKPCNIYNAGKVAINCGEDCKFGCCNNCEQKGMCGAACNNRIR